MKLRNIFTLLGAFVLVATATLATTATTSAACSYNGYLNSDGKCSSSFVSSRSYYYQPQYQNQNQNRNQNINRVQPYYWYNEQIILAMIERLQEMIRLLEARLEDGVANSSLSVTTRTAINIEEDSATLRGRVYLGNEDEAEVYFEYGLSRSDLDEETSHEFFDDDEDAYTFTEDVEDLNDDTIYYFRAVAEDEDNDKDYGAILSFRTDSEGSSLPFLDTREVDDITEDEAELHGYVDMNDYDSGQVFFVYGEDSSMVEDVSDDYDEYSEIDEQGEDLQKESVDNDLDGTSRYQLDIDGLDNDTRIYYSICVEFDDSDNDPHLMCGATESFRTDEN